MSFDMEGIGSEVSQKIRAAIKAKLIELGAYVDDELPDYIMVMVANKRTRSQMDEDLQLFLSSNTKIFTTWLHTVLQKLHEVTVATFESKKQTEVKKSKEKKSDGEEGTAECKKSSDEGVGKVKKHSKKHKESKKAKKNKHKSKEKDKLRSEKKHKKGESKEKSENEEDNVKTRTSQESEGNEGTSKSSKDKMELNTVMKNAVLKDLEKSGKVKSNKSNSSRHSSSSSENSTNLKTNDKKKTKNAVPHSEMEEVCLDECNVTKKYDIEKDEVDGSSKKNKELIEDEFNIEPLEPKDKPSDKDSVRSKESATHVYKTQTTISAPTEELLKVHDKLQNQKFEEEKTNKKDNDKSDSDDSLSPEEMRKQLLLNRAKKRLEESKLAERMKSNSPDVFIEEVIRSGEQNKESRSIPSKQAEPRSARSSPPHSAFLSKCSSRVDSPNLRSRKLSPNSSDYRSQSPGRKNNTDYKLKQICVTEEKRRLISRDSSSPRKSRSQDDGREKKKDIIRISESLEMEKKMVSKKDSDKESVARRGLLSKVVTITDPETPEISSVVKVKPREFVAKEKQANKTLILRAVAEAEKSIATIPPKHKIEASETKKREGLFTKDLRGKRLQNIEVTISKVSNSDSEYRRVSKDSAGQSDKSRTKHQISEVGESHRKKSDLSCRKTSQSEDQFISSKTSGMEKNDKYIRCWLEGVEKAVKEDVMIDPNKIEGLAHSNLMDEGSLGFNREHVGEKYSKSEDIRKRKKSKTDDLSQGQYCKTPKMLEKSDGERSPNVVITMDGLHSKTLKDILTRSKEVINGPLMLKQKDRKEISGKVTHRLSELPKEKSPSSSRNLTSEKMSDRFGRLNPVNEVKDSERRKGLEKTITYHSSERGKKESNNRELIARLSEKFGKVDREFESKKRKYPEENRRYQHESGRSQKDEYEKNGKYRKSDRRFPREDLDFKDIRVPKSRDRFKF